MSYTDEQLELLAHLEANRQKVLDWVDEDGANRWAGYAVVDLDHWAKHGVTSVAQYERHDMEASIWDLYKEVNGIRPRWLNMADMSLEELTETYDRLLVDLAEEQALEADREAVSITEFEDRIVRVIRDGAKDRETAVRWMREAEDDCDDGYFEYSNGLPYGYLKTSAA